MAKSQQYNQHGESAMEMLLIGVLVIEEPYKLTDREIRNWTLAFLQNALTTDKLLESELNLTVEGAVDIEDHPFGSTGRTRLCKMTPFSVHRSLVTGLKEKRPRSIYSDKPSAMLGIGSKFFCSSILTLNAWVLPKKEDLIFEAISLVEDAPRHGCVWINTDIRRGPMYCQLSPVGIA